MGCLENYHDVGNVGCLKGCWDVGEVGEIWGCGVFVKDVGCL